MTIRQPRGRSLEPPGVGIEQLAVGLSRLCQVGTGRPHGVLRALKRAARRLGRGAHRLAGGLSLSQSPSICRAMPAVSRATGRVPSTVCTT